MFRNFTSGGSTAAKRTETVGQTGTGQEQKSYYSGAHAQNSGSQQASHNQTQVSQDAQQQQHAQQQQWFAQQQQTVHQQYHTNFKQAHAQATAANQARRVGSSNWDANNVNGQFAVNPTSNPTWQQQQQSASSQDGSSLPPSSQDNLDMEPQPHNEVHSRYADYYISQEERVDPAPSVGPKSKKMALGSITFTSDQHREFGIYIKDNSFFLRCEKNDPIFCERLNRNVARVNGISIPGGSACPNPCDYWPKHALNTYCHNENPNLRRDMDKSYRRWHDGRCGMHELYQRCCALLR